MLNAAQQLAGIGEVGEIYVRSPHLARGYIDDGALTHERFVTCPLSVVSGQWSVATDNGPFDFAQGKQRTKDNRMYRTGDLGRYRPDGNVEFFGRADQQVKIRGFRVELGEIEAVLAQHEAVREAVVLAREDTPGVRRLVAYVVPDQEQRTTQRVPDKEQTSEQEDSQFSIFNSQFPGELRAFLQDQLPNYMVPALFVLLDALPLTPNGKIDRQALPRPDSARQGEDAYAPPRTALERAIAAAWQEVLQVEVVGVEDNFFELGGSSVHIVQVHSRLHAALGRDVPIIDMFKYPTIKTLAAHLNQEQSAEPLLQEIQERIKRQNAAMERQKRLRFRP